MTNNPIIKGKCFYCKTTQLLEQKPMQNDGIPCQEYFVCLVCNASNSKARLTKDIKEGNAKLIKEN